MILHKLCDLRFSFFFADHFDTNIEHFNRKLRPLDDSPCWALAPLKLLSYTTTWPFAPYGMHLRLVPNHRILKLFQMALIEFCRLQTPKTISA